MHIAKIANPMLLDIVVSIVSMEPRARSPTIPKDADSVLRRNRFGKQTGTKMIRQSRQQALIRTNF